MNISNLIQDLEGIKHDILYNVEEYEGIDVWYYHPETDKKIKIINPRYEHAYIKGDNDFLLYEEDVLTIWEDNEHLIIVGLTGVI